MADDSIPDDSIPDDSIPDDSIPDDSIPDDEEQAGPTVPMPVTPRPEPETETRPEVEGGREPEAPRRSSRLPSSPRLRVSRAHLLAAVLVGLLGFSLVTQARQTRAEDYSQLSQSDLVRLLDDVNAQSARLDQQARDLQQTREQLQNGSDRAAAAQRAARERLDVLGVLAGTEKATGPGITLTVADQQGQVRAAQLLDTVQELRDAGAEAIQIGSVRVVASTSFTDPPDPTVTGVVVDGVTVRVPYQFTAIGDPQTMASALDIPGGVLETLRQAGARGTVRSAEDLTITATRDVTRPRYAVPNPGN